MGTSSSFGGPKKNSALLPSWATASSKDGEAPQNEKSENSNDPNRTQETDDSEDRALAVSQNWQAAKTAFAKFGKGGSSAKKAGESYVRAMGGSKNAARAAREGSKAIGGFGGFLSNINQKGFEQTLKDYGLEDCIGKSAEETLAKIGDYIAPNGSTHDEAIAREAIVESLATLYDKVSEDNNLAFEKLDEAGIEEVLKVATETYIFKKWLNEVGIAIQNKELDINEVSEMEQEIKDYINTLVDISFKEINAVKIDFKSKDYTQKVNEIFEKAYQLIEK
jgi:hypothetical protein